MCSLHHTFPMPGPEWCQALQQAWNKKDVAGRCTEAGSSLTAPSTFPAHLGSLKSGCSLQHPRLRSAGQPALGAPTGMGTLAGRVLWGSSMPSAVPGERGCLQQPLVLGTAWWLSSPRSLKSRSCQEPLLPQWVCAELVRNKQLLQHVLFSIITFKK